MNFHVFGAASSPTACNFALQQLITEAPEGLKGVAKRIKTDFYVDNLLASFDRQDEAETVCKDLVNLLASAGFPLVQFLSSNRVLLDRLPSLIRLDPELNLDLDKLPTERTLGYLWDCQAD